MMQRALRSRLLASGEVAALVGNRIDWLTRPQGDALPAITLQVISDDRPQHMKGFQEFRSTRVQADVWAVDYASSRTITEALISAVAPPATTEGVSFSRTFVDAIRDLSERIGDQSISRTSLDLIVHHQPAS